MTKHNIFHAHRPLQTVFFIAILLIAGITVYSNSFHAAMVFDDHPFIIADPAVHMTEFSWDGIKRAALDGFPAHRYLPNISFAINYYIGVLDPFGYHVVNLAIHLLTGIFLFFLVKNTIRIYPSRGGVYPRPKWEGVKPSPTLPPETIAFFTALIWIVQPVGTQAVTYICQRMASMVALFYVLSLFLYIKGRMAMMGGHKALPYAGYGALIENVGTYNVDGSIDPFRGGVYPRPEHNTVGEGFIPSRNGTSPLFPPRSTTEKHSNTVGAGFTPARPVGIKNISPEHPKAGGHEALPYEGIVPGKNVGEGFMPSRGPNNDPGTVLVPILYFAGSALAALCAIATKENAGTLPIVILLYEWFFFQDLKFKWSRSQILWALFFLLVFGGAVVWYMGGNPMIRLMNSYNIRDFNMLERVLTQFRIIIYYISLFLFAPPGRLNLDHDYPLSTSLFGPPTTFVCMIAIFALIALSATIAKKERIFSFCILWFFITQATESTIIGIELIFEHRTYIPFMMTSLMLVLFVFRVFHHCRGGLYPRPEREGIKPSPTMANTYGIYPRPVDHPVGAGFTPARKSAATPKTYGVYLLLCAIALLFSFWTYQRNADWQDPVRFWSDVAAKSSDKQRAYQNLAFAYQQKEEWALAVRHYQKALDMDKNTKRTDFATLANIGAALLKLEGYFDAAYYYSKAMQQKDADANILQPLAFALARIGEIEDAIHYYQMVLNIRPEDTLAKKEMDALIAFLNQFPDPEIQIRQLLAETPENPALLLKQGDIFLGRGLTEQAIISFQKAEVLAGQYDDMLRQALISRLARAYAVAGRFGDAAGAYLRLIALAPDNGMAHYNLASVYAVMGNTPKSKEFLKKAKEKGINVAEKIKTDPNFVHLNP